MNAFESDVLLGPPFWTWHARQGVSDTSWSEFVLRTAYDACLFLRNNRLMSAGQPEKRKTDNSPSVDLEITLERRIRETVLRIWSSVSFFGEETGENPGDSNISIAVDPIDGTWAYLTGYESTSFSISVIRDNEQIASAIANPATFEIAYTGSNTPARLVQIANPLDQSQGENLPIVTGKPSKVLVNIHPSRNGFPVVKRLYEAWKDGRIQFVRSAGGSPSWSLVDAAKGHYVYVNAWSKRPAETFDLAAAEHILRSAGGAIVDMGGHTINIDGHQGLLIAGIHSQSRDIVVSVLQSLEEAGNLKHGIN